MANELQLYANPIHETGLTVLAQVFDSAGAQVGADLPCTEVGGVAIYMADMPTAPLGTYSVRFMDDTDSMVPGYLAHGCIHWDGTAEVNDLHVHEDLADVDADLVLVDTQIGVLDLRQQDVLADTNELQTNQGDWLTADLTTIDLTPIETKVDAVQATVDQQAVEEDITQTAIANIPTVDLSGIETRLDAIDAEVSVLPQVATTVLDVQADTDELQQNQGDWATVDIASIATALEAAILNEADGQAVIDAMVQAIGNTNIDETAFIAALVAEMERAAGTLDRIEDAVTPPLDLTAIMDALETLQTTLVWQAKYRRHLPEDLGGIS